MYYVLFNAETGPVAYLNSDLAVLNSLKYSVSSISEFDEDVKLTRIETNETTILEFECHDENDSIIISDCEENEFVIDYTTYKEQVEEPVSHNSFTDEITYELYEVTRVDCVTFNGVSILNQKSFSKKFVSELWKNITNQISERNED